MEIGHTCFSLRLQTDSYWVSGCEPLTAWRTGSQNKQQGKGE